MADEKKASGGMIAGVAIALFLLVVGVYYFFIRKPATTPAPGKTAAPSSATSANSIINDVSSLLGIGGSISTAAAGASSSGSVPVSGGASGGTAAVSIGSQGYSVVGGIGSGGNVIGPAGTVIGQDNQDGTTFTTSPSADNPYGVSTAYSTIE